MPLWRTALAVYHELSSSSGGQRRVNEGTPHISSRFQPDPATPSVHSRHFRICSANPPLCLPTTPFFKSPLRPTPPHVKSASPSPGWQKVYGPFSSPQGCHPRSIHSTVSGRGAPRMPIDGERPPRRYRGMAIGPASASGVTSPLPPPLLPPSHLLTNHISGCHSPATILAFPPAHSGHITSDIDHVSLPMCPSQDKNLSLYTSYVVAFTFIIILTTLHS